MNVIQVEGFLITKIPHLSKQAAWISLFDNPEYKPLLIGVMTDRQFGELTSICVDGIDTNNHPKNDFIQRISRWYTSQDPIITRPEELLIN